MTDSLTHRGPDDSGIWLAPKAGIGLGHRRLSILDLSPLGRQPMHSACGRYVIAYNGEVYNYRELRTELEELGHTFRGGSDTEVLLAATAQWGLKEAVVRFVGMFAFALWDRRERVLSLVRDRLGIKPLYYGWAGKGFIFGSELKALRACPVFDHEVDRNALALYFRHNYVPAPWTIYAKARKLEPGCILTLRQDNLEPEIATYWSALDVWDQGAGAPFGGTMVEAEEQLRELIAEAVRVRMVADVPLGALLSGGIDSSLVVALMQAHSDRPVKTFSIGFHEEDYDEARHARVVAEHLGTEHTELYLTPRDMLEVIPDMPGCWDEPFADSSQIPTYCVSRLTREHVTVALSGDGGDELFAGYQRYFWMDRWGLVERLPLWLRRVLTSAIKSIPGGAFAALGALGYKIRWRLDMLAISDFAEFYLYFMSHNQHPTNLVPGSTESQSPMTTPWDMRFDDRFRQMTFWDVRSYLPDDILTKTDRASMAHGLELRVPLLDHRVAAFAASLPTAFKVRDGVGKQVLRNLLYSYVPREIADRPKMGFGVPVQEWLKGELRDWCRDLLDLRSIAAQGYLDPALVQDRLIRFERGETMWVHQLWDILMFQAWMGRWKP
jgi:asparagine synthase (glutamine-hydrolysing)